MKPQPCLPMFDQGTPQPQPITPVGQEIDRLNGKAAEVLAYLLEHGSALNTELNNICFRYGGRIYDLRKRGHIIDRELVNARTGVWKYTLRRKTA